MTYFIGRTSLAEIIVDGKSKGCITIMQMEQQLPKRIPPKRINGKSATGRPTVILDPDKIQQAMDMAGYGLTNQQIATILNISVQSINNKPELLEAIKLGKELAANEIHKTAYTLAVKDKNPAMIMFLLKCKHGFREKQEVDINMGFKPVVITKLDGTKIELGMARAAAQIEAKPESEEGDQQ